jgi:hypothetical protein
VERSSGGFRLRFGGFLVLQLLAAPAEAVDVGQPSTPTILSDQEYLFLIDRLDYIDLSGFVIPESIALFHHSVLPFRNISDFPDYNRLAPGRESGCAAACDSGGDATRTRAGLFLSASFCNLQLYSNSKNGESAWPSAGGKGETCCVLIVER